MFARKGYHKNMNSKKLILISSIAVLSAVILTAGVIWRKASEKSNGLDKTGLYQSDAWLPPESEPESEQTRNLRELREAINAFNETKSFRAKISISGSEGVSEGQIEVQKPNRFQGKLKTPSDDKENEIIGVDDILYVFLDGVWIPLKAKKSDENINAAFRSSVSGESSVISDNLPDDAKVEKISSNGKSCDFYKTILVKDGQTINLKVCVQNSLPIFIESSNGNEVLKVEYFDYNKVFTIEKPTLMKEFRNL